MDQQPMAMFDQFRQLPFLTAARRGMLPMEAFQLWGLEMVQIACCFKSVMADGVKQALAMQPPDLEGGMALTENLYEEFGEGVLRRCHIHMLQEFLEGIGAGCTGTPNFPATQDCIAEHEALVEEGYAATLATVWANEVCCPIEFGAVKQGLLALGVEEQTLAYLDANLEADIEHSRDTWRVLRPFVLNGGEGVTQAVQHAIGSLSRFYEGLYGEYELMMYDTQPEH